MFDPTYMYRDCVTLHTHQYCKSQLRDALLCHAAVVVALHATRGVWTDHRWRRRVMALASAVWLLYAAAVLGAQHTGAGRELLWFAPGLFWLIEFGELRCSQSELDDEFDRWSADALGYKHFWSALGPPDRPPTKRPATPGRSSGLSSSTERSGAATEGKGNDGAPDVGTGDGGLAEIGKGNDDAGTGDSGATPPSLASAGLTAHGLALVAPLARLVHASYLQESGAPLAYAYVRWQAHLKSTVAFAQRCADFQRAWPGDDDDDRRWAAAAEREARDVGDALAVLSAHPEFPAQYLPYIDGAMREGRATRTAEKALALAARAK